MSGVTGRRGRSAAFARMIRSMAIRAHAVARAGGKVTGLVLTGLVIAVAIAAAAGCGGGGSAKPSVPRIQLDGPPSVADLARGRKLFQVAARPASCGFCHSFRAAAAESPLGPDLDAEVTEVDLKHLTDSELAQRVVRWMTKPLCLNPSDASRCMPVTDYSGDDLAAVAVFVAICGRKPSTAGCEPVEGLRGEVLHGEILFQTRGCVGCHFSYKGASTGPALNGLAGSKVELADGRTVVADDAYLRASIATPDAATVKGYSKGVMRSRVTPATVTKDEIDALITYIKTLK